MSAMNIVKLTDRVSVSAQITPQDVAEIAAAGYKVLINNRPDGEEAGQPGSAEIAAAAEAAGLDYHYMPVTAGSFPGPDFDAMTDVLNDEDHPVLAFCRTGTRSTNVWVAGREDAALEQAIAVARRLSCDLGMAFRFLGR
jgi:uncharacterized protein (TIGR01244 family)